MRLDLSFKDVLSIHDAFIAFIKSYINLVKGSLFAFQNTIYCRFS